MTTSDHGWNVDYVADSMNSAFKDLTAINVCALYWVTVEKARYIELLQPNHTFMETVNEVAMYYTWTLTGSTIFYVGHVGYESSPIYNLIVNSNYEYYKSPTNLASWMKMCRSLLFDKIACYYERLYNPN